MSKFCKDLKQDVSKKSRLVAFLLCYIFGLFGAHRFYANKELSGVVIVIATISCALFIAFFEYSAFNLIVLLLVSISLVTVLLVDMITIILGKFKTAKGAYIKKWIED